MLYLIGTGIHDYKDMSLRAYEIISSCERVFFERYTSSQDINIQEFEERIGKKVEILERHDLEDNDRIFSNKDTALLVIGDPLVATTHQEILERAREKGIKTRVIHSSSIVSAICETGLHIYKFGKITSIPFTSEEFKPKSPGEIIEQNLSINAHTLCLLDIGMESNQAIDYLLEISCLNQGSKAIICADLGGKSIIVSGSLGELRKKTIIEQPQVLIIPAEMHFTEEEKFKEFENNG